MVVRRTLAWSAGLLGLLFVTMLASARVGYADIGMWEVTAATLNGITIPVLWTNGIEWISPFSFNIDESTELIIQSIRLPRIVLGAIVGFALAAAGTVMQGFFRNPMADPSIIGISTGAALGAVTYIVLPLSVPGGLPLAAFAGGLGAGFLVYAIATEDGQTPVATLLLAGIAIQTLLGAMISYLLLHAGDSLEEAVYWLMGHLHHSSWGRVQIALPIALVMFVWLLVYTRDLNALLLGEEEAHGLGIDVQRTKQKLLAGSSVITAAAVAVSGVIGFVGLIVPHIMRLIVGPDHRILLPVSALAGAVFLVATDTIARAGPSEMPVGIVTAALGAPFFLYLLRRQEVYSL
ncbi:vitamin B12 ABC transporter permease BtuC [Salinarchaeum sp. IM2453]|uniref:vitamin B12 ABC transporter permease BtuC n=1 Tax=Salinarchaeum sp. IM2453 TaxID=2862870 RepID=UPI001C83DC48|nr:vitamin B12 ABC transporter permease BtuC [Salinarchaeum sp. IM2453]QZA87945.1 vitamin B12 ABC transporter permease BtuC [Salinarchaeum sp. IM2453]